METDGVPHIDEPKILVIDIPVSTTADEAAQLLKDASGQGLYFAAIVPWPGVGARAFFRQHAARPAKATNDTPKATCEAAALQFLRDNREMTVKQLVAAFKALRFPRSESWITQKRAEVIRAERRLS